MRTVVTTACALLLSSASALAHADPTDTEEPPAPTTRMRSPMIVGFGATMIVVGAGSGGLSTFLAALASQYGGSSLTIASIDLWAVGSWMTLVTGITLVAFGATQVSAADTWQTGVWLAPGGLTGRF